MPPRRSGKSRDESNLAGEMVDVWEWDWGEGEEAGEGEVDGDGDGVLDLREEVTRLDM